MKLNLSGIARRIRRIFRREESTKGIDFKPVQTLIDVCKDNSSKDLERMWDFLNAPNQFLEGVPIRIDDKYQRLAQAFSEFVNAGGQTERLAEELRTCFAQVEEAPKEVPCSTQE